MSRSTAEIVREYGPFEGADSVHGVTYDGQNVWFAAGDKLIAFDPASGKTLRSIDVAAHAGTAFDGQHLFQLAEDRIQKIDPKTGRVLATIPAPGRGGDSGLTWAEGTLWVGQYRDRKIHQIDPQTGAILRTIESNRFVTGVTWIDGELWHGTWEGDESDVGHVEPLQDRSRSRIDSPPIALVPFPGAVPELAVDPGDPGDEAVGLNGAKNRPCLGIDLMDLPVPILPHPERPFGPREPRVTAAAGRRDRGEHTAGLRIDLLDATLGDLKQVLAVEGRSCMRGDIDRAQRLPARRIEGAELVSGRKPDVLTVKRNPTHVVGTRKGSILAEDFGR